MAGVKGEVSIFAAVEKLEANTVRARTEGLEALRLIFGPDRSLYKVDQLSDTALHKILESLFDIVRVEKPNYVRAATSKSAITSKSRLNNTAKALRVVVDAVGHRLKQKTANALLDHVIDTLPDVDGGFCSPIQLSYLRIFNALLSHAPRAEHLRHRQWQTYVDFGLKYLQEGLEDGLDIESPSSSSLQQSLGSRTGVSISIRTSQASSGRTQRQVCTDDEKEFVFGELLSALKYLTGITNAPLMSRFQEVLELLVHWLQSVSWSDEVAFDILNNVLPTALSENVVFAATIFNDIAQILHQRQRDPKFKKPVLLRENVLATMSLCRSLFLATSRDSALLAASTLEQLLYSLRTEYENLKEHHRLQIDDLGFTDSINEPLWSLKGISLVSEASHAVNTWAALLTMANLQIGISRRRHSTEHDSSGEIPPKRRKLEDPIHELFHSAASSNPRNSILALPLALFVVNQEETATEAAVDILSQIHLTDLEDEPVAASWTCLLLARIVDLRKLADQFQPEYWRGIWSWACRASTATATTRSACYLLYVMIRSKRAISIMSNQAVYDGIFQDGGNGPTSLTDSALLLLTEVLTSGLLDSEKSFKHFVSQSLRWLDNTWTISSVPDRSHNAYNAQIASFARSDNLYTFLTAATGMHVKAKATYNLPPANAISKQLLVEQRDLLFTKYMLSKSTSHHTTTENDQVTHAIYLPHYEVLGHLRQVTVDMLTSKVKSFLSTCQSPGDERPSFVSLDVVETAATVCLLCCTIAKDFGSEKEWPTLQAAIEVLWEVIYTFLTSQSSIDFKRTFSKITTRLTSVQFEDTLVQNRIATSRMNLCTNLETALLQHLDLQQKNAVSEPDFIVPDLRSSQGNSPRSSQTQDDIIRSDLAVCNDINLMFARQRLSLKLDLARSRANLNPRVSYGAMVIDSIVALDPDELLAARDIVAQSLVMDTVVSRSDASRLLTRLAQTCLEEDSLARCEAALCLCLRITMQLAPLWTADQDDDLSGVANDIYQWYINIALGKGIASQRVLLSIAALLDSVLRCDPSYSSDSLPSARTCLLKILQTGQIGTQFQVVDFVSNLFNGYVLSEHSAVFDDIIDNLPSDPDKYEGIILRLYVIASLGAQWHTILRQSIYHIFETAANVPSTVTAAAICVQMICQKLKLSSPRFLFRLFSPQVLYTWLERHGMESIPFLAFAYDSLSALQHDAQDELVAQVAMRGSTDHVQSVVQSLGVSWDSLVERWFAKVVAYSIMADVAISRTSREIGKAEMALVQQVGEESYANLCRTHLAKAVAYIFLRLSDDRGFERANSQDTEDQDFSSTYNMIYSRSSSQIQLPPGQQPSFRAKHLVPILDRICMRGSETLDSLWTPALLVHVYRALLADARPAFGPLHTCGVLRKIRVLISLAGSVALTGYPLLMLLHALRPFLTQFHSSEDAFGIFWYLLEHGKTYLQHKLPFITGLSVAIFASLSRFASSSQDSTTQESHFASTMSKAQEFRTWLARYLEDFSVAGLDEIAASTFANIVQAAKRITKAGNSARATAEGSLLYHILADQASPQPLLATTFFRLTLRSLCHDFKPAADFRDDILYSDSDVLKIAPVLVSTLDHQSLTESFNVWALQALGRAYSLQGPAIIESTNLGKQPPAKPSKADIVVEDSYQNIVNILGDLLWDEEDTSASASEATLQSIFSALPPESRTVVLGAVIDQSIFDDLRFIGLSCPSVGETVMNTTVEPYPLSQTSNKTALDSDIVDLLCKQQTSDPVLSFLPSLIKQVPSIASALFPHVVHLALNFEAEKNQKTRDYLTGVFGDIFDIDKDFSKDDVQLALKTIIHLRRCVLPLESTMAKRNSWLAVDFGAAAAAALRCKMYGMALFMLEIHSSQHTLTSSRSSKRSSHGNLSMVPELLNQLYRNIDDPDFFYGTREESDVASIVEKLSHEGRGYKALSFQSALFDSNIRTGGMAYASRSNGGRTVSALTLANLSGLSSSIGSFVATSSQEKGVEHSLQSLLNLHQWDIVQDGALPEHGVAIANALRTLSSASQRESIIAATDVSTAAMSRLLRSDFHQRVQKINCWTSLSMLSELKEMLSVNSPEELEGLLDGRSIRRAWTEQESFDCIEPILLGREAIFATIKNNPQFRSMMKITAPQAILLEIKSLRNSLSLGHIHEMSQFCLNRAAYLKELLPSALDLGVKVEAAIQYDLANTFWAQHETDAAIRILQDLRETELPDQAIEVQQSEILTDLGSKITEARLDRPDEVTAKYLIPAIKALGNETMGSKVGRVFHNFAAFCDSQLRDPDNVDEYERVEKIRNRKLQEVLELESMYKKGDSKTRDTVKAHFSKAKTWFKLDDEELQRLKAHRDRLIKSCLENYLLSLRACEDFPNDVLRFLALWMEQSASAPANTSVSRHLLSVPTYKFAPLMNQLSSRILNEEGPFQHLLSNLMYHICEDHPFHSLYQIFATSKSKGAQKDEVANSRHTAATKLSEKIMKKSSAGNLWISIHNSNIQFVRVAQEKITDKELKTGSKLLLRGLPQGVKLEQTIHDMHHKIPPPTMKVEIRPDRDYSLVPTIAKFDPQISIAGGVSAPKIATIIATDGSRHKMLLKGGNDDLRQDSIMEQVFEQVSNLLKDHRPTRQRKLGIRTYKVIPLTHNAGIIEFVRDTMPLHDYVLPAHTRYYPKDYKPQKCRKEIADAQSKSLPQRLQAYRNVVANFHPVMRFFFMEHFLDPDDWFQKRLNYSRSTAAISMLGHVLGLGDRHGHNILLDTKTGEVVHIDLGVAFEAGRVLPVPEVVPFRLTRDLVDGMGLSGVEGVFRRCCNFTLEALRRNQEAIMTILDVLKWDPLYSWSVSPLRLARMQENQEQAANADTNAAGTTDVSTSTIVGHDPPSKRNVNEPSEADRALAVVSKKLGKSLSVEATVNELIRQAMDERNLAVLYCGWAAYA